MGQSVGVCGGSGELVKRKRKTPEGTCVGQWIGRSKKKKGKPEEGNPRASGLAKMAVDLGANRFPDAHMSGSVGFMVGVWVVFGVIISPAFGTSIPVVTKLVLRS